MAACGPLMPISMLRSLGGKNVGLTGADLRPVGPRSCSASVAATPFRLCVTEAAIDAISLAALDDIRQILGTTASRDDIRLAWHRWAAGRQWVSISGSAKRERPNEAPGLRASARTWC